MIIDDVTIEARAGKGGDGVVRFAKAKFDQGPTGGNGGRGGDVVLVAVSDLGALRPFRQKKRVTAGDGGDGEQNTRSGKDGADVVVRVPVGTVATDLTNDRVVDLARVGQRAVVARGGSGGFGNHHFRSGRNTSPKIAKPGQPGEHIRLRLELKMIADVGLIGLPNVGKSSFLNAVTNARSKVADYHFTTLEPHLGVYYGLVLADIPGLIEGAADGKGLGHKFLRHIERTRVLFHFVSATSPRPVTDYRTVREELRRFNPALAEKPEWIVVSRADEVSPERLASVMKKFTAINPQVMVLSVFDDTLCDIVKQRLNAIRDGNIIVPQNMSSH